jgi:hypothetical protein
LRHTPFSNLLRGQSPNTDSQTTAPRPETQPGVLR